MTTKIDLDKLDQVAAAATHGEWEWYGNTKSKDTYLATKNGGRVFVMTFARWGMASAQPRFQIDHRMVSLSEMDGDTGPRFEVPYRRDFVGIGHPDAVHIAAASPPVVRALIARIRELESALDGAETDLYATGISEILEKGVVLP